MTLFPDAAALDADVLDALRLFGAVADVAVSEPVGTSARVAALGAAFSAGRGDAPADVRAIFFAGFLHSAKALYALRPPSNEPVGIAPIAVACAVEAVAGRVCADALRWHCERWDGTGKPDGLFRGEVPVNAATLGAARLYVDAMLLEAGTDPAYAAYAAYSVLSRSGRDIQPSLADAFVAFVAAFGENEPVAAAIPPDPDGLPLQGEAIAGLLSALVEPGTGTRDFAQNISARAAALGLDTDAIRLAAAAAHLTAFAAVSLPGGSSLEAILEAAGAFGPLAAALPEFVAARRSGDPAAVDAALAGLCR